jgi:hypothetical protein
MSRELVAPADPALAIRTYLSALPLIDAQTADLPARPSAGPSTSPSFTLYREFWRWTERLLWRAVALLARHLPAGGADAFPRAVQLEQLLAVLAMYRSYAWPPAFRPAHRAAVYRVHLRVLVVRARALPPPAPGRAPPWMAEARAVVGELRAVLGARTRFPRAEERNGPVLDLLDVVVALWEAAGARGEAAGWAIDVRSVLRPDVSRG